MFHLLEEPARARVQAIPSLHGFYRDAHTILAADSDAFGELFASFKDLAAASLLTDLVNYELRSMNADAVYLPELAGELQMTLFRTDHCGLDLEIVPTGYVAPAMLHGLTEDFMIASLGNGQVRAKCFLQPDPFPCDRLSVDRVLQYEQIHSLDKEALILRAEYDLFSLELVTEPAVLLLFSSCQKLPIRWEYASETGRPVRMLAASPISSRIQFACRALAHLEYSEASDTVAALIEHPDHYVRWTSVTTLVELDFAREVDAHETCLKDMHPHIRQAAYESLVSLRSAQEVQ